MAEPTTESAANEPTSEASADIKEIPFKTITNQAFKISFPLSTSIGDVKKKIFEENGADFEPDRQKLIYNGKVLEDSQTLADVNVDEKKYIVIMVSRKKVEVVAPQPQQSSSSVVDSTATNPPASTTASTTSVPTATVSPTTTTAAASTPPTQQPAALTPEQEETVNTICAMGYSRDEVIRALHAAFFNADRAVEYLCTGIPSVTEQNVEDVLAAALDAGMEEEGEEGEEEGVGDPLSFLRSSPQFAQLCQLVRSQPNMLQEVLAQIAAANPELMQVIRDNQEAFVQMLNESTGEELPIAEGAEGEGVQPAHEAGHLTIAVTETDRAALQRLQSMGFPEQLVIEAYFACDKNEDLAVNYILARLEEVTNEQQ